MKNHVQSNRMTIKDIVYKVIDIIMFKLFRRIKMMSH